MQMGLTGTGRRSLGWCAVAFAAYFSRDLGAGDGGRLAQACAPVDTASYAAGSGHTRGRVAAGRGRQGVERRRPLAGLTTPQLCALWRKSRAGLHAAPTPADRARVAATRGVLLDELERREPEVMADWLQSGAREPEGPSAYLVR